MDIALFEGKILEDYISPKTQVAYKKGQRVDVLQDLSFVKKNYAVYCNGEFDRIPKHLIKNTDADFLTTI